MENDDELSIDGASSTPDETIAVDDIVINSTSDSTLPSSSPDENGLTSILEDIVIARHEHRQLESSTTDPEVHSGNASPPSSPRKNSAKPRVKAPCKEVGTDNPVIELPQLQKRVAAKKEKKPKPGVKQDAAGSAFGVQQSTQTGRSSPALELPTCEAGDVRSNGVDVWLDEISRLTSGCMLEPDELMLPPDMV